MYALKTLLDRPLRFVLTVIGVALCIVLMLFLLSVYRGVADGSVEYVRVSDADLWVMQRHATNILRCTSLLTMRHGEAIRSAAGVDSVAPILFILATVQIKGQPATLYITGYDRATGRGGPPALVQGEAPAGPGEIVIDRSFAAKHGVRVGDRLPVKDDTLTVVGLSAGTNMFVIQYAFVTLEQAQAIAGYPNMVSCFQVRTAAGADPGTVRRDIEQAMPDIAVYDRETFLANNVREMESGFLPLLYVVALISAVVLTAILSLILSVNVLERRNDFAIMKALGAPGGFIPGLVVRQALIISGTGMVVALLSFFPLIRAVEHWAPEVSTVITPGQLALVALATVVIGLISSIIPNQTLRHVYPLEVFK